MKVDVHAISKEFILTSVLYNIYFHEFDLFLEQECFYFSKGKKLGNFSTYSSRSHQRDRIKNKRNTFYLSKLKRISDMLSSVGNNNLNYQYLYFTRYAND